MNGGGEGKAFEYPKLGYVHGDVDRFVWFWIFFLEHCLYDGCGLFNDTSSFFLSLI